MRNRGFHKKYETKAAALLAGLVFLHFVFTVIYVTPNHYFPKAVNEIISAYMLPVFHQGWNLFAPDPPVQEKSMLFRFKSEGKWTKWLDPGKELLEQHDRWRLSNANIEFRLHQNAAYRVWEEHYRAEELVAERGLMSHPEEMVLSSRGYRTARYYAFRFFEQTNDGSSADSVQLKLIIATPPAFNSAENTWSFDTINFPKDGRE